MLSLWLKPFWVVNSVANVSFRAFIAHSVMVAHDVLVTTLEICCDTPLFRNSIRRIWWYIYGCSARDHEVHRVLISLILNIEL